MRELQSFDIRNFIDQLVPNPKEKGKFICPACGEHNFQIKMDHGQYTEIYYCWNDQSKAHLGEIREALKPWREVLEETREIKPSNTPVKTTLKTTLPRKLQDGKYDILATINGATLPFIKKISDTTRYIEFIYSEVQKVIREETLVNKEWKKNKDGIKPWHLNDEGKWICGKGKLPWLPYKWEDMEGNSQGKWVLFVEGEKCVEYARVYFGLVALTFQGGSWGAESMQNDFQMLRDFGVEGIVVYPDYDKPGSQKADKIKEICTKLNLPCIVLDPLKIYPQCQEHGDIVNFYLSDKENTKNRLLNAIIHSIEEYNQEKLSPIARAINEAVDKEMPKLEEIVRQYKDTQDPIKQNILRHWLASQGYNLSIVDSCIHADTTPKKPPRLLRGMEFINLQFDSTGWVYPELLKDASVTLLTGGPGSMKTTFAYDMMFHYLLNQSFLGEELSADARRKNKRGLIINADQPGQEAQEMCKQSKMGLTCFQHELIDIIGGEADEEKWNLKYLPWLEQQIKLYEYSLIIVDSYSTIHDHIPEWNEWHVSAALGIKAFTALAEKYRIAVVIIHHDGKNEEGTATKRTRGSSAIPAAASAVMGLKETKEDKNGHRDQYIRFLEISKMRGGATGKSVLRYLPEHRQFVILPDGEPHQRETLNNIANSLYGSKFKSSSNRYTYEELKRGFNAGVTGDRDIFLNRVLTKLQQRGVIEKVIIGDNAFYQEKKIHISLEDLI